MKYLALVRDFVSWEEAGLDAKGEPMAPGQ